MVQLYSGTVNDGATVSGLVQALPAESKSLSVTVLSTYQATAATTGVKLRVGASIDGGATFSDYADVVSTRSRLQAKARLKAHPRHTPRSTPTKVRLTYSSRSSTSTVQTTRQSP